MFWLDLCSSLTLQRREQKQSWHILLNLPNKNNLWVTEVLHVQTGEWRDLANQYLLVLTRSGEWVGRKEPWAGSSEGVTLLPRTWHPSVSEGLSKYYIHFTSGRWLAQDNILVYESSKTHFFCSFSADEISWGKDQKASEQPANVLKKFCCVSW